MVRSAIRRGVKYARKIDGVISEERLLALKDQQIVNYNATMAKQVQLDTWIKSLQLGRNEVYYIIFAKQINKLIGKFKGNTLLEEVCGKRDLWQQRGLTPDTLDNIISRFNIGACEIPVPCADWANQTDCEGNGCYWYNGSCHSTPATCVDYDNQTECEAGGCYWYNGSCHSEAATCPDYNNQTECEANGCYWYDGSCHTEAPPEDCFEQNQYDYVDGLSSTALQRMGQRKTITNKTITKLGFWLHKNSSPTGDVTFTIRKVSDDSIINSKVWGDASAVPTSTTYLEVTFDTPVNVNEEVRLQAEFSGGASADNISFEAKGTDVVPDEFQTEYRSGSYTDRTNHDAAYKYCWST